MLHTVREVQYHMFGCTYYTEINAKLKQLLQHFTLKELLNPACIVKKMFVNILFNCSIFLKYHINFENVILILLKEGTMSPCKNFSPDH